ncbi:hypothetical protein PsYK624_108370 [Phanerochaete sordida]|uniref:Uncharacterized protein n=1 Tax=Phanerochaete sordida TaxID=48140 RepID=A0A9P3GH23_9APHY|nr:hypothetical protein PsYK624_108370 [Phanerochaete sordida]
MAEPGKSSPPRVGAVGAAERFIVDHDDGGAHRQLSPREPTTAALRTRQPAQVNLIQHGPQ